jgi:ABC-type Fe3+/spermidine/putrescine transport system ATPase subunit
VMSDRIAVMNEGRIIQEGSPREIYTRPASVFASDFIGDTNLIAGTVTGAPAGSVKLSLASGATLSGESTEDLPLGTRATLSVRPEAIRVTPHREAREGEPSGPIPSLRAEIAEIIYLGNRVRLEVSAEEDLIVIADLREEEAEHLERGMTVWLTWPASAASVWADRSDQSHR